MTAVRIPPVLRPEVGGQRDVIIEAATVGEALRKLVAAYPALEGRVLAGDQVPSFLNLFVDGEDVRLREGLETPLGPESALLLLPAVAGGSGENDLTLSRIVRTIQDMASARMKPFMVILSCAPVA